jgi:hypothetical protein
MNDDEWKVIPESKLNILKIKYTSEIPENFTGVAEYTSESKAYYLNGKKHRVDGPAVEFVNGYKEWFLNGIYYSQEEWFELLSEEDKLKAIWNLR